MDFGRMSWRKASYSNNSTSCVEVGVWRKASYGNNGASCVEIAVWRKASYSAQNSQCVEVAVSRQPDAVCLVRDTKDRSGPALAFIPATWANFTAAVKSGEFANPA